MSDLYHVKNFARTKDTPVYTWEGARLVADAMAKESGKSAEITSTGGRRWLFWDGIATPCWKMDGEP
jgi:hypothetical protein